MTETIGENLLAKIYLLELKAGKYFCQFYSLNESNGFKCKTMNAETEVPELLLHEDKTNLILL